MAKMNLEFDTVSKQLVVTMDGSVVDNVEAVQMFKMFSEGDDPDKFAMRVVKEDRNKGEDLVEVTQIMANEITKKSYANEIQESFQNRYGV